MSECMICSKECTGKTCSGACRAKLSRRTQNSNIERASERTRTVEPSARSEAHATISIDGAIIDIARHEPIQLGRHDELVTDDYGDVVGVNRSRTTGCRVSIPGDEDYDGVCEKVDGAWRVNKQPSSNPCELTRIQIEQAIRAYPHDQWVNSPEHKELLRRLHSMTIAELEAEGYHVPAWKVSA